MNSNSNTASFGQQPQQGATHATDNRKREHNDGVGGCSAVASSPSQSSGQSSIQPEQFRKVFIGGLNYRTSEVSLRDYFSKYGVIVDCVVMQDQNGRSRGFGFVTYSKSTMVDDLMKNRPHLIDGREVDVKRAMPKESATPEIRLTVKKIFIGAIKEGITEKDLKDYFGQYGSITDCVVMRDCNGMHRGFGFVEFDDIDAVDRIVLQKNHTIKGQSLDVKKAVPKKTTALQAHQQKMSGSFTPGNFNNNRFSRDDFVNRNGGLSSARGRSHPYNSRSFGGGMDAGGRSSTAFYNRRSANNYAADDSAFSGGEIGNNNNSHHPYYQHENRCRGDSLGRNDYRVPSNSYARRSEFGNNDVGMYNNDSKNDLRTSNFSNRGGNGGYNSGNLLNNQHYQHDLPPSSSIGPIRPNRRDFDHHGGNNIFDDTNNVASNEGRRGTTYRQDRSAARVHDIYKRNDVASGYNAVDQSPCRFTSSSYSYQQRNDNNMSSSRYTRDIINSDYPANSSNRNSFASSWNNNPAHQQPLQLERSMDRRDDSGVTNFFDNDIIDHPHRDYDRANSRMRIHQQDCRSANCMNANNRDYNSYGGNIPASDYNQDNSSSKINNIRRRGGGLRNSPSSYNHPSNSSFGAGGNVPSGTSGRFNSRGRGRNFNGPSSNQAGGGGGGGRFNYSSSNNNFNNDVYDNRPPLGNSANTLRNVGNGSGSYWSS
ncbi:hypothetical protein GJ496_009036 [Pomphorhynchus laevis]|nr:hypothetical protein GJ496_009036 [Pomphorhynchus laevis]